MTPSTPYMIIMVKNGKIKKNILTQFKDFSDDEILCLLQKVISEYIKLAFFKDNYNIFEELDEYFKHNYFSFYGINLLIARIIYPSFYFELYDEVIQGITNESSILKITSRIDDYENYLNDILNYFHKY